MLATPDPLRCSETGTPRKRQETEKKEVIFMPFVRVTSFPQTQEAKAEIAQGVTEVVHKVTKIPKEYISVVFETMPPESWSVGGTLVSEKK
jgi:4-oxalocrotonate tautomerase family enzyme